MAKCNGMPEQKFRSIAKKAVTDYWNENQTLSKKFGSKAIQNFKALLGVNFDGDGMYFEFTLNGDANEGYLDVYKKQKHVTVTL